MIKVHSYINLLLIVVQNLSFLLPIFSTSISLEAARFKDRRNGGGEKQYELKLTFG